MLVGILIALGIVVVTAISMVPTLIVYLGGTLPENPMPSFNPANLPYLLITGGMLVLLTGMFLVGVVETLGKDREKKEEVK